MLLFGFNPTISGLSDESKSKTESFWSYVKQFCKGIITVALEFVEHFVSDI